MRHMIHLFSRRMEVPKEKRAVPRGAGPARRAQLEKERTLRRKALAKYRRQIRKNYIRDSKTEGWWKKW